MESSEFRSTIFVVIHPSARKHGVPDADIRHAVFNAIAIEDQGENRVLFIGPARDAAMLEVVAVRMTGAQRLAIHAMAMRSKYRRLLLAGSE